MAKRLATPGVYVVEKSAFSTSAVALPTAVPAFIGYTEKAVNSGKSLINKPTRVTTLAEFENFFGGNIKMQFAIETVENGDMDIEVGENKYKLEQQGTRFYLYDSLRFYFANGGGEAWIVSVGNYVDQEGQANEVSKSAIAKGLQALIAQPEPTLVVIPDLMNLAKEEAFEIQQQMMMHCSSLQSRFAILDVYGGIVPRSYDEEDVINIFREGMGIESLAYGAAYYPWLTTSIVSTEELNFTNIANKDVLAEVLTAEAELINSNPRKIEDIKGELAKLAEEDVSVTGLSKTLKAVCPAYTEILTQMQKQLNILPPSGGIAGLYARIDDTRGVWKSPANESLVAATSPVVKLTNEDQEDLNVTVSGKSINAVRHFPGEGTIVWGARTLDGNSQDWRYISVRRTLTYIEQTVKNASRSFVFEPNTSSTWVAIKATIVNFLTSLWQQGGLAGGAASDAFLVEVGLGSTMTGQDILEGILKVTVKVALVRPAEFIVITFQQKMQES